MLRYEERWSWKTFICFLKDAPDKVKGHIRIGWNPLNPTENLRIVGIWLIWARPEKRYARATALCTINNQMILIYRALEYSSVTLELCCRIWGDPPRRHEKIISAKRYGKGTKLCYANDKLNRCGINWMNTSEIWPSCLSKLFWRHWMVLTYVRYLYNEYKV